MSVIGRLLFVPAALALATGVAPDVAAADPTPSTPIRHLVVLLQEDRTFDSYFGTFAGAAGPPAGVCMPLQLPSTTPCRQPFHLDTLRTSALQHGAAAAGVAYNAGGMNGFATAQRPALASQVMGHYDGSDLPLYWNLASDYVLADHFFSSAIGGSVTNHVFAIAARPPPAGRVPAAGWDFPTIFDRLDAAGVSWKYYVRNYQPAVTYRTAATAKGGVSQVVRVPLLALGRYVDDPSLRAHIVDETRYFEDLGAGTLPAVSFIVASGATEQAPSNVSLGERHAASLVMALMRSSAWSASLFVLAWDDWGGWYDHLPPPQVDSDGYGFRVPAIFVSPYAPQGRIDHTVYDFTSILRFIEINWSVSPLTARDATAASIAIALDLTQAPRAPQLPASTYPPPQGLKSNNRPQLVAFYALVFGFALVGLLWLRLASRGLDPGEKRAA